MGTDSTGVDRRFGGHENLVAAFRATVRQSSQKSCLLFHRDGAWRSWTYREFAARAEALAAGRAAHGISPGDRVAIVAENSPEWMLADFGGILAGAHVAGLYAAFPPEETAELLAHSGSRIVFAGDPSIATKVSSVRNRLPALERIVLLSGEPPDNGHGGDRFFVSLARFERD